MSDTPLRTLRTSVTPEVFYEIEMRALGNDTVAASARRLLTDAVTRPFRDDSDAALAWIVKMQLVVPDDLPHKRRAILQWAREQGFPG